MGAMGGGAGGSKEVQNGLAGKVAQLASGQEKTNSTRALHREP